MFWALRELDIEIRRGEVVGIIGKNGSGKSTLLKLLARVTEPSTGYADVTGKVGSLLEVGTGFHPELTGRQNVFLNGSIMGMSHDQIERRFDEIVSFAEVEAFIDTPVKHYSSGMYMRLAFSVAAHMDCDILIVDEVLAVGDAHSSASVLRASTRGEVGQDGAVRQPQHLDDHAGLHALRSVRERPPDRRRLAAGDRGKLHLAQLAGHHRTHLH